MSEYWILEYGKVLGGYIFLMYIWPLVVFRKHLKSKTKIYCYSFCVTVQIVIVNTLVLMMGLFHLLNGKLIACLFYGIFIVSLWWRIRNVLDFKWGVLVRNRETGLQEWKKLKALFSGKVSALRHNLYAKRMEYFLLFIVTAYGMIYFSYGASQVHSYGQADLYLHHKWINDLVKGKIFPDGIYPEALHCFVYVLNSLFGIQIQSIMMFLQCIHIGAFFISAYILLREIFNWRYSPIFVLGLFVTLNFTIEYNMYRMQMTLPMEFGLHTQFLCAAYLIKYLKGNYPIDSSVKRIGKYYWNENLILFSMALAASIAIHFYTTFMAFILCASFAVFSIKKIINIKYLFPLLVAALCGISIAVVPMAGGLISGILPEDSLYWGLNIINENSAGKSQEATQKEGKEVIELFEPTVEDWEVIEKLPESGQKIIKAIIKIEYLLKRTYKNGCWGLYGQKRGKIITALTMLTAVFWLISRWWKNVMKRETANRYAAASLISFLSILFFAAYNFPELGLPVLIPNHRFCSPGQMMTLAVMIIPVDILFAMMASSYRDIVLQRISFLVTFSIYVFISKTGNLHDLLYYSISQYDAAVVVTNAIIREFPEYTYTIIAPREEYPQIEMYGEYEEISRFIEKCSGEYYSIPTKYVFIYVEKKPIQYYQQYHFSGPLWLGKSSDAVIEATEISKEAAQEDLSGYENDSWGMYEFGRTVLESKVYEWCQTFSRNNPSELNVYYEDDNFVCYYFEQDIDQLYNLAK